MTTASARHAARIDFFLDGPEGVFEEAVHVVHAGEEVRKDDALPAPDLVESEYGAEFRLVSLEALVRTKLTSFRRKDQVHLLDLLGVGRSTGPGVAGFRPSWRRDCRCSSTTRIRDDRRNLFLARCEPPILFSGIL